MYHGPINGNNVTLDHTFAFQTRFLFYLLLATIYIVVLSTIKNTQSHFCLLFQIYGNSPALNNRNATVISISMQRQTKGRSVTLPGPEQAYLDWSGPGRTYSKVNCLLLMFNVKKNKVHVEQTFSSLELLQPDLPDHLLRPCTLQLIQLIRMNQIYK